MFAELRGKQFDGCVRLDLSHNRFVGSEADLQFIEMWIRNDTALKHLILSQLDTPQLIGNILAAVHGLFHFIFRYN